MHDQERLALEHLALAGLLHDLPALFAQHGFVLPAELRASLDAVLGNSGSTALLRVAEAYAAGRGESTQPVATQPLRSIFSYVQIRDQSKESVPRKERSRTIAPLPAAHDSQDALFPADEASTDELQPHLKSFYEALVNLSSTGDTRFEMVYPHLLALLQRYGWCLSAHSEDVSLFDHARLTSAIAVCLHHCHAHNLSAEAVSNAESAERFCLLVGDLSGIQSYIFNISTIGAGGVARRLRARSFYLSALADVLSHQIAECFKVPLGNVIMASGGKFYVLVPNVDDVEAEVGGLRHEIDEWLRNQFNGEIAINLAQHCFAGEQFQAGALGRPGFGEVLSALSRKLNREKRRRGQSVLADGNSWSETAFAITRDFWGASVCMSCRKNPTLPDSTICEQCDRDVQLGRILPRARYVAYYSDNTGAIKLWNGWSVDVYEQTTQISGAPYLVAKLNDPQIDELRRLPGSFRFLANYVPLGQYGAPLTFEDIANEAKGRALLGYVKADVDYLGTLFAQGLQRDAGGYDTAAHIAALSREFDLFFSGWVQHLLSRTPRYRAFYTIFSGGDDLFLVGPWDQAAALAMEVHDNLHAFTGENKDVSLSAGVLFTKERYPIARAAEDAEDELEHSKERKRPDGSNRNQITVLGDTLSWDETATIFNDIQILLDIQLETSKHEPSGRPRDFDVSYSSVFGEIEERAMRKLYVVNLTDEEHITLRELVRKGMASARKVTRAHILLQANDGASDQTIADTLHIGRATVERVRKRFVEGNLARALNDAKRPGAKRKLDGKQEALLVATACSTPPEGRARWTMQLLADKLVTLTDLEGLSDETVRRTLKKTPSSPGL